MSSMSKVQNLSTSCALPSRPLTKVANPPGGKSTFTFGNESTESSPPVSPRRDPPGGKSTFNFANSDSTGSSPKVSPRNPPGGKSTLTFGNESPTPLSPRIPAVTAPIDEVAAPEPTVVEPEEPEVSIDNLKIQIFERLLICEDTKVLQQVLSALPKDEPSDEEVEEAERLRALDAKAAAATKTSEDAISQLKAALKLRGTHGIISMGKKFRSMDDDGDKKLSYLEFHKALTEAALGLSEGTRQALFRAFDSDCSGLLSFDEFLTGVRGDLNPRRQALVNLVFKTLDVDRSGALTVSDIATKYDTSRHPDVLLGAKSKSDILAELLETFEVAGTKDGVVTPEEFSAYYKAISACVDDDDYFELVLRNAWHISGGEGWCQNTTCTRVLVLHQDGHQSVEELEQGGATDDVEALKAHLAARGIAAKKVSLYGDLEAAAPKASPTKPGEASPRPGSSRKSHLSSSIVF